ncbi:MAG: ATP-binding protein [bacterium]
MFFYAITGLVNAFTSTFLGFFVFSKNPQEKINKTFSLFCLSVAVWSYAYFFWQISNTATNALFWTRALMFGAIFIPVFYLDFVLAFLNQTQQKKMLLRFAYALAFLFSLLNFTPLFVKGVGEKLFFRFWPTPGITYHPFLILWFLSVAYCTYLLCRATKMMTGIKRAQAAYVLSGITMGFIGGSTNYFLWYDIPILPLGNILVVIYVGATAYAIVKYRLMDIRIIIKKSTIYLLSLICTSFLSLIFWHISKNILKINFRLDIILYFIFAAIAFEYVKKYFTKIGNKYLYANIYNAQQTLKKLTARITTVIDIDELSKLILNTIKETIRIKSGILAAKNGKGEYVILGKIDFKGKKFNLSRDNELIAKMEEEKNTLLFEEMDGGKRKKGKISVKEEMRKTGIRICIPMVVRGDLKGFVMLGEKESGEAYTKEDVSLLEALANQTAVAMENAYLYDKLEEWNDTLKEKVAEQTKDIRKKNATLKKLLNLKTEFLHTASHQLRTPVSAIKGLVSMLKEGDFDDEPKEIKNNAFEGIFNKTQKMTDILDDILIAAELDTEENYRLNKLELKPTDICEITKKVMRDLAPLAKEREVGVVSSIKYHVLSGEHEFGDSEIKKLRNKEIEKLGARVPSPLEGEGKGEVKEKFSTSPNLSLKQGEESNGIFVLSNEINLRHILRNLLNNAIVYSRRGGEVEIGIEQVSGIKYQVLSGEKGIGEQKLDLPAPACADRQAGIGPSNTAGKNWKLGEGEQDYVVWSVRDNGIGVPKKSQKYLFEKFKRGENANTMNCDGSGLGLFIVKKLVEAHPGGEYGFESEEGNGSEFWVKFKAG